MDTECAAACGGLAMESLRHRNNLAKEVEPSIDRYRWKSIIVCEIGYRRDSGFLLVGCVSLFSDMNVVSGAPVSVFQIRNRCYDWRIQPSPKSIDDL